MDGLKSPTTKESRIKKSEKVKMVVYGNKPVLDTREHAVCFVVVSKDFGVDLEL